MIWARENDFDLVFAHESERTGVPIYILKGVTAKESSFNPRAFRPEPQIKDASRGLMQVLYGTAKWIGYTGSPEGLFDPSASIAAGADVLRRYYGLATATGGGWEDTISMFNAGMEKIAPGKYTARKLSDGSYLNQAYVDDVKVYAGYFKGTIPEATAQRYMKTKILDVAIPALMAVLVIGAPLLLRYLSARPAL